MLKAEAPKLTGATPPELNPASACPCIPRWSMPNGFGSTDVEDPASLPSGIGTQQVTFQALGSGCGMFHARVRLKEEVQFSAAMVSERPIAVLRLPRAGRVEVGLQGADTVVEASDTYGFFLHGELNGPVNLVHQPAEQCDAVIAMISEDRLSSMLAGMRVPKRVEQFFNGNTGNVAVAARMSATMRRLTHRLLSNPYTGDLRTLYRNGVLLEAVAAAMNDWNGSSAAPPQPHRVEHAQIAAAIELLSADLARPPSLEAVAGSVGLSQRRMAELFRASTGMTVVAWVAEKRIEQAAVLLRESSLPVKEVAYYVGYAHIETFTTAFTRRFGVPPARYRRSVFAVRLEPYIPS